MAWFGIYIAIAAVVALTVFVASNWLRQEYAAAPDHSGMTSAVAGLLWPALVLGVAELALICFATRTTAARPSLAMVPLR